MADIPAFPVQGNPEGPTFNSQTPKPGMSLRDYFAEGAMRAIIGSNQMMEIMKLSPEKTLEDGVEDGVAVMAYHFADAMLKAREPKP